MLRWKITNNRPFWMSHYLLLHSTCSNWKVYLLLKLWKWATTTIIRVTETMSFRAQHTNELAMYYHAAQLQNFLSKLKRAESIRTTSSKTKTKIIFSCIFWGCMKGQKEAIILCQFFSLIWNHSKWLFQLIWYKHSFVKGTPSSVNATSFKTKDAIQSTQTDGQCLHWWFFKIPSSSCISHL